MKIIQSTASLDKGNHMNFNPRVVFPVPAVLLQQVFSWVNDTQKPFKLTAAQDVNETEQYRTAQAFLSLMDELRKLIIQDAAAMLIAHPDCANHGLFQLLVFQSQIFIDFKNKMRRHLEDSKVQYDASINKVLLGVHEQFDGLWSIFSLMQHHWVNLLAFITGNSWCSKLCCQSGQQADIISANNISTIRTSAGRGAQACCLTNKIPWV